MTREEFSAAAFILDGSWPGEFTKNDEAAYWHMLSDFDAADVLRALKAMRSAKFRPSPGEIANALSGKAGTPTFDDMLAIVFGVVLAARPPLRGSPAAVIAAWEAGEEWDTADSSAWEGQTLEQVTDAVQLAKAAEQHPLIESFVQRHGLRRLRGYNIDTATAFEEGKRTDTWDRKELREAWESHCSASDEREVSALASGTGARGLARLDPLHVLPQIGTGG